MLIFDADDPRVLDGTYDREGYTPADRRRQAKKREKEAIAMSEGIDGGTAPVTKDRAARRFAQVAALEVEIAVTEAQLKDAEQHVKDAREVVTALRERVTTLWHELRDAVRDKGQLPLFDFPETEAAPVELEVELVK
jgi:hypothetical protein